MKTLEWKGPCSTDALTKGPHPIARYESISDAMARLHHEKHANFRRWQDALTMNMIFGDNYVTVPAIPKGYEDYAKWWYDNELKSFR